MLACIGFGCTSWILLCWQRARQPHAAPLLTLAGKLARKQDLERRPRPLSEKGGAIELTLPEARPALNYCDHRRLTVPPIPSPFIIHGRCAPHGLCTHAHPQARLTAARWRMSVLISQPTEAAVPVALLGGPWLLCDHSAGPRPPSAAVGQAPFSHLNSL